MRITARAFCVVTVVTVGTFPALAAKLPPVPSTTCGLIAADAAPKIDGALDEPVWSQTQPSSGLVHADRTPAQDATDFRLLCDGKWLYIGVTCHEDEMDKLVAKCTGRDKGRIWADDAIELFIAPVQSEHRYYHLIANTVGGTYDGVGQGGREFDADWRTACKRYEDRWTLEIAVGLSSIGMKPPSAGDAIDFNIGREHLGATTSIWSYTGKSFHARGRFGEVVFGSFADRLPALKQELEKTLEAARLKITKSDTDEPQTFADIEREALAFLALALAPAKIDAPGWRELKQTAHSLGDRLGKAVLAARGVIVWACNPMRVPLRQDQPSMDVTDARRIDVRVLANEWESACLVVSNVAPDTLDLRVRLSDLTTPDGKTKINGWDVIQVRTAPHYFLSSGTQVRDPLVDLQRGDLFRVASGENELLWLTFKSKGLAPGQYRGTLTVRALDNSYNRKKGTEEYLGPHIAQVDVVFRVYPLALGAEHRPRVQTWNYMLSGPRDQMLQNARDYYLNVACGPAPVPFFKVDSAGDITDETLDFSDFDRWLDELPGFDFYTISLYWPSKGKRAGERPGDLGLHPSQRWSPKYKAIFKKWLLAFRDHMTAKGFPCQKWALYLDDEPHGERRREVLRFAKEAKAIAPDIQTYTVINSEEDAEELEELSRNLGILTIGRGVVGDEARLNRIRDNVNEAWLYSARYRGDARNYVAIHRGFLIQWPLVHGFSGTGFWAWTSQSQGATLWYDEYKYNKSAATYKDHLGVLSSLRAEAFREGIEDWKYMIMLDEAIARGKAAGIDQPILDAAQTFRDNAPLLLGDAEGVYRLHDEGRQHLLDLHIRLGDVDAETVKAVEAD